MTPTKIIIHHSLTADNETVSWDAIKRYHIDVNGWQDIGYHYGIEKIDGAYHILKGRLDNESGAHCKGFNDHSLGICVIGDFDRKPPDTDQLTLLTRLIRSFMAIYGIKPPAVLGHRETYALRGAPVDKTCPGKAFDMERFRNGLY